MHFYQMQFIQEPQFSIGDNDTLLTATDQNYLNSYITEISYLA